jgi:hypothetical protein
MRFRRITIWFFLGYLLLLWNVSPSAHHAEWFGFHAHSEQASHAHKSIETGCCCQHSHDASPVEFLKIADHGSIEMDSQCDDCLFCWYFDHFSAIDSSVADLVVESPLSGFLVVADACVVSRTVAGVARGPPRNQLA